MNRLGFRTLEEGYGISLGTTGYGEIYSGSYKMGYDEHRRRKSNMPIKEFRVRCNKEIHHVRLMHSGKLCFLHCNRQDVYDRIEMALALVYQHKEWERRLVEITNGCARFLVQWRLATAMAYAYPQDAHEMIYLDEADELSYRNFWSQLDIPDPLDPDDQVDKTVRIRTNALRRVLREEAKRLGWRLPIVEVTITADPESHLGTAATLIRDYITMQDVGYHIFADKDLLRFWKEHGTLRCKARTVMDRNYHKVNVVQDTEVLLAGTVTRDTGETHYLVYAPYVNPYHDFTLTFVLSKDFLGVMQ